LKFQGRLQFAAALTEYGPEQFCFS
jgi:hypothetical protein